MAKFNVGDKAIIKKTGEKVRVMGQKKDGLYTVTHLDGRMYGDFAEGALSANSVTSKNPIVQNALEATVRNVKAYDGYGRSIKVGDEVDTNKGLARVVQIKNRNDGSIHGVASYIGLSYKPNSNAVDEWISCRTDGSAHGVKVQNSVAANGERTPASIIKLDGKAGDLYLKVTETLREYVSSLTSLNAECARLKDNEFLRKDELRVAKESLANITRVNY